MNVVALAGGVGGAKLADGLARCLPAHALTIIVNTGDDFEHLGLRICPDLDTVCYTLAGLANPETGWGRKDESWNVLEGLSELGGPDWFRLGDRDLATHLERTRRLKEGQALSQVTRDFCRAWGLDLTVLPMSDDVVATRVYTNEGELPFQEYFVRRQCRPQVKGFRFQGASEARPAPGVVEFVRGADLIVICPSNPWVSIDPIFAVTGIEAAVRTRPVVAVSPIIGGQTIKGPAAKMYAELGVQPSAVAVARHYQSLLSGFVLDRTDSEQSLEVEKLGVSPMVTDTVMKAPGERQRLAEEVLKFGERFVRERSQ